MNPDEFDKYRHLLEQYVDREEWPDDYKQFEDAYYDFGFNEDGKSMRKYTYDITRRYKDRWADFDINNIEEAQHKWKAARSPCLEIFIPGDLVIIRGHNMYDCAENLVGQTASDIGLVIEVESYNPNSATAAGDAMALVINGKTGQPRWVLLNDLSHAAQ